MLRTLINREVYIFFEAPFKELSGIVKNTLNLKREVYFMIIMTGILILYAGCSASWSPSDQDAVKMLKEHYLFYRGGEEINAEVVSRAEYIKECKCYPVKFKVLVSENNSYEKTFYFFKNQSGGVDIRKYKLVLK
ncbi:MAG: hypothetical protein ABFR82_09795 [Nitrospirota bacterium]